MSVLLLQLDLQPLSGGQAEGLLQAQPQLRRLARFRQDSPTSEGAAGVLVDDRGRRPFAIGIFISRHRLLVAGPHRIKGNFTNRSTLTNHAGHDLRQHEIAITGAARSLRRQGFVGQHFHAHTDHSLRQ